MSGRVIDRWLKLLGAVLGVGVLVLTFGCAPAGRAVGDTQRAVPPVDHDTVDLQLVLIGLVGSRDVDRDRSVLKALADDDIRAVYAPIPTDEQSINADTTTQESSEPMVAASNGVKDFVTRRTNAVIVVGLDMADKTSESGQTHKLWQDSLECARQAGIPVILLDPVAEPEDDTLYAAMFTSVEAEGDTQDEVMPLSTAVLLVVNDQAHERQIAVSLP